MVASSSHSGPPPATVALMDLRPTRREGADSTDSSRPRLLPPRASVTTLSDPSTDESRQYLSLKGNAAAGGGTIYELNALSTGRKHSSFFVGSRVVSSGSASVGTAVDPLFFVLACVERKMRSMQQGGQDADDGKRKWKWQPLEQALDDLSVPSAVRRALRRSGGGGEDDYPQLRNLFEVTDQFGDDLLLYKFSEDRVGRWLETKHVRVLEAVREFALTAKRREAAARAYREEECGGNGAFSAGFVADGGEEVDEKKEEEKEQQNVVEPDAMCLTKVEEKSARVAALQFMCGYLGESWRAELVRRLSMSHDDLLSERELKRRDQRRRKRELEESQAKENDIEKRPKEADAKKRKFEEKRNTSSESDRLMQYAMGADGAGGADAAKAKEEEARKARLGGAKSVGLKKLAKVNTKGMKSLASFFGGGGAKKAKKQ